MHTWEVKNKYMNKYTYTHTTTHTHTPTLKRLSVQYLPEYYSTEYQRQESDDKDVVGRERQDN